MVPDLCALQRIPDIDLDLAGCGRIGPHGLPPPVVVTLARRPDRWQAALKNLRAGGIHHVIKAEGVDGRLLSDAQIAEFAARPDDVNRPLDEYLQLTRPAIGCFLSHLAIWKRFLTSGEERILVLEDDAVPSAEMTAELARRVLAAMPRDADMLLLGCTIMDGLAAPTVSPMFSRVFYYNGTYAYLLTRKGCQTLLPLMLPLQTHVDNRISLALVENSERLRVYCSGQIASPVPTWYLAPFPGSSDPHDGVFTRPRPEADSYCRSASAQYAYDCGCP